MINSSKPLPTCLFLASSIVLACLGCSSAVQSPSADGGADAKNQASDPLPPVPAEPWDDSQQPSFPTTEPLPVADLGQPSNQKKSPSLLPLDTGPARVAATPIMQPPESESSDTDGRATSQPTKPSATESLKLSVIDPNGETPGRGLRMDLSPKQLVNFLATADKDMQTIVSGGGGITDPEKARQTLIQIVKMKLEASRRLAIDSDISDDMRSEGQRGQLQSLSHLASLGDLSAAKELKLLATENLNSTNADLVSDSRLVLIGFGIEDLQNGVKSAADDIVQLVRLLAADTSNTDVPAMMVMGQARQILANYGNDLEAREVRDTIVDLFANSTDANVAKMAAAMAGNVRFDAIDGLIDRVTKGQDITTRQWTEAAETLIDESADLQTVQYLAGTAIDFESRDKMKLAEATYNVLQNRFTDQNSASYKELEMALEAKDARRAAIGREFDFTLPSIDGAPLSMSDYRGRIVLMPFWSIEFPASLQILPKLKQLADRSPDKIAIVGMNLDPDVRRVQTFVEKSGVDFRSFRAESSEQTVGNPAAAQFGVVSLPCVAIFDPQGRAVKVDFAGRQLDQVVKELLE